MNFRAHSTVYFTTGIAFIACETFEFIWAGIVIKALIIPLLIWLYASYIKAPWVQFHRTIVMALVFSWAGDMTIQLTRFNESFFLIGVGCFLIAQLIYLVTFFRTPGPSVIFSKRIYLVLPVAAYGIGLIWYMGDGLGDMRVPIIIYAAVILTMLLGALNREKKVNYQSYLLVFIGALLFVLSDTVLAINKFKVPFDLARVANMSTYVAAQYFIAIGCLKQFNIKFR